MNNVEEQHSIDVGITKTTAQIVKEKDVIRKLKARGFQFEVLNG